MAGRFKPPCKFFLQGTCRNGNNCRFSHVAPFGGRGGGGGRQNGFSNDDTIVVAGSRGTHSSTTNPFGGGGGNAFNGSNANNPFGGGRRASDNSFFDGGSGASQLNGGPATGTTVTDATRALAVEELRNPGLWPFSGFSVHKGLPNVVDGDLSFEEVRMEAYEQLKMTGSATQQAQRLQTLQVEMQRHKESVLGLLENPRTADRLFNGESLAAVTSGGTSAFGAGSFASNVTNSSPFGVQSSASPFGTGNSFGTPAASPFGSANANLLGAMNTANPFGQAAQTSPNPFGQTGQQASPFGQPAASPFGQTSQTGLSPFGQTSQATVNPFGQPAQTTTSPFGQTSGTSGSPFGQSSQPNSSPFGQSPQPTTSPFGQAAPSPFASTPSSPFGAPSSPFGGAPSSPFGNGVSSSNPFGTSSSSATAFGRSSGVEASSSAFGSPASTSFGNSASSSSPSPFAPMMSSPPFNQSSNSTTTFSPFTGSLGSIGMSSTFGSGAAESKSLFGQQFNSSSTQHVAAKPKPSTVEVVAKAPPREISEEELTAVRDDAWNAAQFQSSEFRIGMVPTVPPPPEYC